MATRTRIHGLRGPTSVAAEMWYKLPSGVFVKVAGTPAAGDAPLWQADGSIAWGGGSFAWLYLTGVDGTTGDVVIIADGGTGEPVTAYTPVS